MTEDDADGLVPFLDVRVIASSVPALFCAIGKRRVWLPRFHISGKLWRRGDRGTLLIRRWVALDRRLAVPSPVVAVRLVGPPSASRRRSPWRSPGPGGREAHRGD